MIPAAGEGLGEFGARRHRPHRSDTDARSRRARAGAIVLRDQTLRQAAPAPESSPRIGQLPLLELQEVGARRMTYQEIRFRAEAARWPGKARRRSLHPQRVDRLCGPIPRLPPRRESVPADVTVPPPRPRTMECHGHVAQRGAFPPAVVRAHSRNTFRHCATGAVVAPRR